MKQAILEKASVQARQVLKFPESMVTKLLAALEKTLDDAARDLAKIDVEKPDYLEIRRVTHILMGNAATVGADYMADLALLLNAAAHAAKPEACKAGLRLLLAEIR